MPIIKYQFATFVGTCVQCRWLRTDDTAMVMTLMTSYQSYELYVNVKYNVAVVPWWSDIFRLMLSVSQSKLGFGG